MSTPRMKRLSTHVPPDPYAAPVAALRAARQAASGDAAAARAAEIREARHPEADPRYKPYGTPPDGYAIALAIRQLEHE